MDDERGNDFERMMARYNDDDDEEGGGGKLDE